MNTTLKFNPREFSDGICRLILAKAEEWRVTPSEALARLLDGLAAQYEKTGGAA